MDGYQEELLTGIGVQPHQMTAAQAFGDQMNAAYNELLPEAAAVLEHLSKREYAAASEHGARIVSLLDSLPPAVHHALTVNLAYGVVQASR